SRHPPSSLGHACLHDGHRRSCSRPPRRRKPVSTLSGEDADDGAEPELDRIEIVSYKLKSRSRWGWDRDFGWKQQIASKRHRPARGATAFSSRLSPITRSTC